MSKKLRRILDEITKAEEKLAQWQGHLDELHIRRKQIEDAEIIKSVRSMNLEGREMLAFLENLQSGAVAIPQGLPSMDTELTGSKVVGTENDRTLGEGTGETGDYWDLETEPGEVEDNSRPEEVPAEREDGENEEKD